MAGLRRGLKRWRELRAFLLVVLACTLGSAGMLPVWAQLAGVEGPHACHCAADHHGCVCARCGTDPDGHLPAAAETLKGRCGDDEVAFGGRGIVFVLPPSLAPLPAAPSEAVLLSRFTELMTRVRARPPTPPPRFV